MLRSLCIFTVAVALLLIGCADTPPDKREALKPEEKEPRYPGLEVNPPDVYEYMQTPSGLPEKPTPSPPGPLSQR